MSTAISARNLALILILYFGWSGVLVVVVPILGYRKTRQMGANPFQAIFLAATSCLLISWFIFLVDAGAEQRQLQALGKVNDHRILPTAICTRQQLDGTFNAVAHGCHDVFHVVFDAILTLAAPERQARVTRSGFAT